MPIRIVWKRHKKTKTKNAYLRGSHLGIAVDKSARTDQRSLAVKIKKRIEGEIERGEYGKTPVRSDPGKPTFVSAAITYMEAGHSSRYVQRLIDYFKGTPLADINQAAIDECATMLYPNVSSATRNRLVYTPISAILHHAKVKITLERPKGAKGKPRTNWYTPADAFGIIKAAESIEPDLSILLIFLLYTGPRIGAAVDVQRADLMLEECKIWARPQKGQVAHAATLRADLRDLLARYLASHDREKVFRWRFGGRLQWLFLRAKLAYLQIPCPVAQPRRGWREPPNRLKGYAFHTWRHTWGTWMRLYANATVDDLVDSNNWHDRRAAAGYVHAAPAGAWNKVEQLPALPIMKKQA